MHYVTDVGGGEMDQQAQNGEVVMGMIGPQPDPNGGAGLQDAEMEEDESRSEATFRFTVPNFSKLKVSGVCWWFQSDLMVVDVCVNLAQ